MLRLQRHLVAFLSGLTVYAGLLLVTMRAPGPTWYLPVLWFALGLLCAALVFVLEPTLNHLLVTLVGGVGLVYGGARLWTGMPDGLEPVLLAQVLTEVAVLAVLVVLAQRLSLTLRSLAGVFGHLTATGSLPERSADPDDDPRVRREIARSRRYRRPISVVVMEADAGAMAASWPQLEQRARDAFLKRYAAGRLQRLIARHARVVDVLLSDPDQGRFVVVCPEAQGPDADGLIQRIRKEATDSEGLSIRAGLATFPDGALTLDTLLVEAAASMQASPGVRAANVPPARETSPRAFDPLDTQVGQHAR